MARRIRGHPKATAVVPAMLPLTYAGDPTHPEFGAPTCSEYERTFVLKPQWQQ